MISDKDIIREIYTLPSELKMDRIRSTEELMNFVNCGNKVKYINFWGHQNAKSGVSKSCFSQWYSSAFEADGKTYLTAEHFMMAAKARLFNDYESEQLILNATDPGKAKKLGRGIRNFDEGLWLENRFEIVVEANCHKFSQNPEMKEFLKNTGDKVLVEASPVDKIWGVGLAADDSAIDNPNKWRGLNLLGFALMEVRDQLN